MLNRKERTEFGRSLRSGQGSPRRQAPVGRWYNQDGMALLMALIIMSTLSMLSLSIVLLTESGVRLGRTVATRTQAYYAAVAGIEEARGRLNPTAADAISSALLPQATNDVLYIINSSALDPVAPTDPSSRYYDSQYVSEFSGGFGAATVIRGPVASDQPSAGTSFAIPYKWVRITRKTEYSSQQDVDQDGLLNSTITINWTGTNQDLASRIPTAAPVYKLTALAVEPSGIRKMAQAEVAGSAAIKTVLASRELSF